MGWLASQNRQTGVAQICGVVSFFTSKIEPVSWSVLLFSQIPTGKPDIIKITVEELSTTTKISVVCCFVFFLLPGCVIFFSLL